ncbi:hypothetical protein Q5762_17795 [Streptomyces sp. P9(2023)]|uniref:hypothetical protein n=1 Tax=Streptomyces sp. P9(2023) TaxID=3064394 RepID=UPI0028F44D30|nr:hypothetical protein [Streptomyces sp. P9(2023)]MDT9690158.1 hypothetical protein [Streptomyces sp. P9(2023)]
MTEIVCAACDAVLSAPLSQVALPGHAHQTWGNGVLLPVLMEPGTYAVEPEPYGPPWRTWSDVGEEEAAARGVFAPVHALSYGDRGAIVVAPGDTRGTVLIPERCGGYCCGLDGGDGPNLACEQCGRAVATRVDDCSLWQAVWFAPHAVRRLGDDAPAGRDLGWEVLARPGWGAPPVDLSGVWSRRWEAVVGAGLAHLVAASGGTPVTVPDGLLAITFGRVLGALLPPGGPVKRAALAGPGLHAAGPAPDIALVPRHPRTGEPWRTASSPVAVALDAEVWAYLALGFRDERFRAPATGGLPEGVLRDDPLPLRPAGHFWPDPWVFIRTLARLPAVRQPWLRSIYDRVTDRPFGWPGL